MPANIRIQESLGAALIESRCLEGKDLEPQQTAEWLHESLECFCITSLRPEILSVKEMWTSGKLPYNHYSGAFVGISAKTLREAFGYAQECMRSGKIRCMGEGLGLVDLDYDSYYRFIIVPLLELWGVPNHELTFAEHINSKRENRGFFLCVLRETTDKVGELKKSLNKSCCR